MSNWINVPYHSNQVYIVRESAIRDVLKNLITQNKKVKMSSSSKILIDEKHLDLQVFLDIKIKKAEMNDSYNIIKNLVASVEEAVRKLIDKKPKNVQISLIGTY
ncbi:hypothetical protein MCANUF31_00818 [Mycoplasmopsis canis UF31]|uniref:MMB_0454 family protein n=1 Tax=Mycoplasmopsis canis TaxID=29555 RepID=UPI00025AEC60|nr:hypothetical protein [Mycoplasmopsis canis]AKF41232.1 hypothetical protein AAW50_02230 [Mycoplasmopsis canis]EIE40371.1 hypothetical protein MCANUF31_00818 [Mycoplasmopsis canis UF31]EIE41937.1 hypothetical protein MCANUFG1_00803 [Mycoplasmopsis canis UFG1]